MKNKLLAGERYEMFHHPCDQYGTGISMHCPPAKWPEVFLADSKSLVDLPKSACRLRKLGKPVKLSATFGTWVLFSTFHETFSRFPYWWIYHINWCVGFYHSQFYHQPQQTINFYIPVLLERTSWVNILAVYGPSTLFRIVAKFLSFAKRSHPVCNDSDSRSTWTCPGAPIQCWLGARETSNQDKLLG